MVTIKDEQNKRNRYLIVFIRPNLSEQKPAGIGAMVFVKAITDVRSELMFDFSQTRPYFVDIVSFIRRLSKV